MNGPARNGSNQQRERDPERQREGAITHLSRYPHTLTKTLEELFESTEEYLNPAPSQNSWERDPVTTEFQFRQWLKALRAVRDAIGARLTTQECKDIWDIWWMFGSVEREHYNFPFRHFDNDDVATLNGCIKRVVGALRERFDVNDYDDYGRVRDEVNHTNALILEPELEDDKITMLVRTDILRDIFDSATSTPLFGELTAEERKRVDEILDGVFTVETHGENSTLTIRGNEMIDRALRPMIEQRAKELSAEASVPFPSLTPATPKRNAARVAFGMWLCGVVDSQGEAAGVCGVEEQNKVESFLAMGRRERESLQRPETVANLIVYLLSVLPPDYQTRVLESAPGQQLPFPEHSPQLAKRWGQAPES